MRPVAHANMLKLTLRYLWRYPLESALCGVLAAIATVSFAQVLFRYVFKNPLSWSEELASFLLVWLVGLGAAYGFKNGSHFVLVAVVAKFPGSLRRATSLLVSVATVILLALLVVKSLDLVRDGLTQIASASRLPMATGYSSVTVSGILMIYYVVRNAWREQQQFRQLSAKQ